MSQIVRIEFGYGGSKSPSDTLRALPTEQFSRVKEILLETWDEEKREQCWISGTYLIYVDEIADLTHMGFQIIPKAFKGNYLAHKVGELANTKFGEVSHVHVHIPNIGLLAVDEVTWLENACTQELQHHLDQGWRILAVCPPNSVRRPDYILGRTKKA